MEHTETPNQYTDLAGIALYLEMHPILHETSTYKTQYLQALHYFVHTYCNAEQLPNALWQKYCHIFLGTVADTSIYSPSEAEKAKPIIRKVASIKFRHFKFFSYRFVFVADCLFLCAFHDETKGKQILDAIKSFYSARYHDKCNLLFDALYHGKALEPGMELAEIQVDCWQKNSAFLNKPLTKILVTANMSAGKSTLINALIGKPLVRTSQEACTKTLCHLYNKPFEDGFVDLYYPSIQFGVADTTLSEAENAGLRQIASYYHMITPYDSRVCIIDTPGVNSAIHREHGRLTKKALTEESYDWLVYVLNANYLGTDDEFAYLRFVSETVPKEKTIFVLNKVDSFQSGEDSIEESIQDIRKDLCALGYENPIICPISAYCALLIKKKVNGLLLDEDENDSLDMLSKKFRRPKYDLSQYYARPEISADKDEITDISIRCGLYGLEHILFHECVNGSLHQKNEKPERLVLKIPKKPLRIDYVRR